VDADHPARIGVQPLALGAEAHLLAQQAPARVVPIGDAFVREVFEHPTHRLEAQEIEQTCARLDRELRLGELGGQGVQRTAQMLDLPLSLLAHSGGEVDHGEAGIVLDAVPQELRLHPVDLLLEGAILDLAAAHHDDRTLVALARRM